MTDVFDGPAKTVDRDRYGRPLIVPPKGGKAKAYTRCTTFVDVLDDKFNLQQWQQRMVALGLASRPDLLLAVSAHAEDKNHLNRITGEARDAAAASAAATTGTAIHALTEKIDRGEELPPIPEAYRADLEAYRRETRGLDVLAIEQFLVHDEYAIGGTADRDYGYQGRYFTGDVKTGNIDFGALKIAMQLSVYSRSTPYDPATGKRTPRPYTMDTSRGIIVHLPAGTGTCQLRWVDLDRGWQAVQVAAQVRQWRKVKDWYSPFVPDTTFVDAAADFVEEAINTAIDMEVDKATTLDELRAVYSRLVVAGEDPERVLVSCNQRRGELEEA